MDSKRIVFVGGGSGGHFYPLMAVAEAVLDRAQAQTVSPPRMYYMGPDPYDPDALTTHGITYVHCSAGKRRRYVSPLNVLDVFKTFWGILEGLWKLFVIYPDVIMSKGGYTSVPVVVAAWLLRIPIVIHESDAVPGTANKFASRLARYIAIAYAQTIDFFPEEKTALIGIPIRKELLSSKPPTASKGALGLPTDRPVILILGGSQGAARINQLVLESLDELLPHYTVVHQTGEDAFIGVSESAKTLISDTELLDRYYPFSFLDALLLNEVMHRATVVVSRAGSGTIHEIAVHGLPAILVPIPEEVSHDQRTNAYAYARTGAAVVMEEKNLQDGLLAAEIARMIEDQQTYTRMREAAHAFAPQNAAAELAGVLVSISEEH